MHTALARRVLATALICLATASASASVSAGLLTTEGLFGTSNTYQDWSYGNTGAGWLGGPTGSLNYTTTFTGLNSAGGTQTMTVAAQASATAEPGVLRAATSLVIANPFYNTANAPYVNPDQSVNANGAPDSLSLYSGAFLYDSLSVSASPALAQLRLSVLMDGTIDYGVAINSQALGSAVFTQASVTPIDSSGSFCISCGYGYFQGPGSYSRTFDLYIPVNDPTAIDFGLQLGMFNQFYFTSQHDYSESETYAISLDFSHTLKITGVAGSDASGAPVTIDGITSSLGFSYPVTAAVPEPATALLGLLGLAALCLRVRRPAA